MRYPPFSTKLLSDLNFERSFGIEAQVIMYRNNRDNTVMAASTVNELIAAPINAIPPKNSTEFAGVSDLG